MQFRDTLIAIILICLIFVSIDQNLKSILIPIALIALAVFIFYSEPEHMNNQSNEAVQDISSIYNTKGTLVVPSLNVVGDLTVGGATTLSGALTIAPSGSLAVSGPTTLGATSSASLSVVGQTTLSNTTLGSTTIPSSGSLTVAGPTSLNGLINLNGATTIPPSGSLNIQGDSNFSASVGCANGIAGGHRGCNFHNIFG
jgi:hypothetical protein